MLESLIITVSLDRPIEQTVKDLSQAGCVIKSVLMEVGVITVICDDDSVKRLRGIAGVTDVSPGPKIDIGPPGAPETW